MIIVVASFNTPIVMMFLNGLGKPFPFKLDHLLKNIFSNSICNSSLTKVYTHLGTIIQNLRTKFKI